ncbi:MAG: YncE family protein [Actinobacteria bacterium]|nr:YncE family protein [Actinomycetota bacterium]
MLVTISERTGKVVGRPIKVGPSPVALAADEKAVWVADANGTLSRIDVRDRRVTGERLMGGTPSSVAAGSNAVWVTLVDTGELRFELTDQSAEAAPIGPVSIPGGAVRVALDGGSVWVTNSENTITRVDAKTLKVDPPITVGTAPIGLAVREGVVWVANSEDNTVSRIVTGSTNGPTTPTAVPKAPVAVAVGTDGAWVISQDDRQLSRLDGRTGKLAHSLSIDTDPRGVALGTDRVWIAGVDSNVVLGVLRSALGGGP